MEALPDMKVQGEVQCSFGFGVSQLRHAQTRKILRLFVTRMQKNSPAAKAGLRSGDEILSINGEKVRGMDGEARPDGQLFNLLCNRKEGDTIEIEVPTQDSVKRMTLKALTPPARS